jgi:hypothetical protein
MRNNLIGPRFPRGTAHRRLLQFGQVVPGIFCHQVGLDCVDPLRLQRLPLREEIPADCRTRRRCWAPK